MMTVAILGTGGMGTAMARALLRAGFGVRAWNRTGSRAAPLADAGAVVLDDPRDAVRGADVVVIVVFDTAAVLAVLDRIGDPLGDDTVVVQSATVGLDIETVARVAQEHGIAMVDAPVLGNPEAIEAGRLTVLAAGRPEFRDRVAPVFDTLAGKVIWLGDRPGAASALKLICNAWVQGLNTMAAQSFALGNAFGLDPRDFIAAISGTMADSPYPGTKVAMMLDEVQDVVAPIDGVYKDLRLIRDAMRELGVSRVLLDAVMGLYETASSAGYWHLDVAMVHKSFAVGTPER
jgi:3-hydroxyisobutyrate dehydrogenase